MSPTSFHMSPTSFHLSPRVPGWLVSYFLSFVSHFFSFVSQLGACGRVPGWLVSHFRSFVSHFFSFVSQAGCLWSGSRLACLPLPFICLRVPGWLVSHFLSLSPTSFHLSPFLSFLCLPGSVLVVGFPLVSHFLSHFFSFVSQFFSLSPRLGACGRVCGWLVSHVVSFVSHFFSFVSHFFSFVSQFFSFVSQAGCLWSGSRLACLPLPFICLPLLFIFCLPGWVLVVGFPAGLSPTSCHLSPTSFHFLSPRLGACGRVPGWLVSHLPFICLLLLFICLLSFHLFVSQARCLWSGSRLSPTSFPTSFHLSPSSFHCLPGWVLVVAGLRLACLPRRFICHICLPLLFIVYSFVFQVCRWWCPPFSDVDATCLFICLPALIQTSICLPVSGTCRVVSFLDRITGLCQIQMREEEA